MLDILNVVDDLNYSEIHDLPEAVSDNSALDFDHTFVIRL